MTVVIAVTLLPNGSMRVVVEGAPRHVIAALQDLIPRVPVDKVQEDVVKFVTKVKRE